MKNGDSLMSRRLFVAPLLKHSPRDFTALFHKAFQHVEYRLPLLLRELIPYGQELFLVAVQNRTRASLIIRKKLREGDMERIADLFK